MATPHPPDASTAIPPSPNASLDLERFDYLAGICAAKGSPTTIGALVDVFVEDGHLRVAEMEGSLRSGDLETLADIAHELKGSSATIGAVALSGAASGLQRQARQAGQQPVAAPEIEDLGRLLGLTAGEFRRAEIALRSATSGRR